MKIINTTPYINGTKAIPSGAIPLLEDADGLICVDASGFWINFNPATRHIRFLDAKPTQRKAVQTMVDQFGRAHMAETLEVSETTIDNWLWRTALPSRSAQLISQLLLAK